MDMNNNRGYMLVEIILASVIAFGIAYFIITLTVNLKNKNDDLMVETLAVTDQTIISNKIMKYLLTENASFECNLTKDVIKYKNVSGDIDTIDIVNDYTDVGEIKCDIIDNNVIINVPLTVKQITDKDFDVNISYVIETQYESTYTKPPSCTIEKENTDTKTSTWYYAGYFPYVCSGDCPYKCTDGNGNFLPYQCSVAYTDLWGNTSYDAGAPYCYCYG